MGVDVLAVHEPTGLRLVRRATPGPGFAERVATAEFGTRGLRFVMGEGTAADLARLREAIYLSLEREDGAVVGTYALAASPLHFGGQSLRAWYRSLLTVAPEQGGQKVGRWFSAQTKRLCCDALTTPAALYGFIDPDNLRSIKIAETNGYQRHLRFQVVESGWHAPRDDQRVGVLEPGELPRALALLRATWVDHVTTDLDATVRPGEVFVLREGGALRCGVQVVERRISVTGLPGLWGRAILGAAGLIAKLSPLFVLRDRHFAWAGNFFFQPGAEASVGPLLQAVQRRLGLAGLVSYFDPASPALASLQRARAFGPLAWLAPGTPLEILLGANAAAAPFMASIAGKPWLFSSTDVF
ncbi:MAG: hypothetical protein U0228_01275 [Myxococcaceae bacterium]